MNLKIAKVIGLIVGKNNCGHVYGIKEISETEVELHFFDGHIEVVKDYGDLTT